jgi:hypothetical protein
MYCGSNFLNRGRQDGQGSNGFNRTEGSFSSSNQSQSIGTYRTNYKYGEGSSEGMIAINNNWKEFQPFSIVARERTVHLGLVELRTEDYYLIRKGMLNDCHGNSLKTCIREERFNEQLLQNQSHQLLPFSNERPIDIEA